MKISEESIQGSGKVRLHTGRSKVSHAKGAVVVVHGYGDHMGRYEELTRLFNRLGLSCFLYDQRGHGHSGGQRGAIMNWDEYLDDLGLMLTEVTRWHGAPPQILFAHSMGGLVAASYLLERQHQFQTVVLSAPLFALAVQVSGMKLTLAKVISRLLPKVSLASEVKPEMLSQDLRVVEEFENDSLRHHVTNTRWFTEMSAAQGRCLQNAAKLDVQSLLLMQGTADPLVAARGTKQFFQACTVDDSKYIPYPGLLHEIFNELKKDQPLADLEDWLGQRI